MEEIIFNILSYLGLILGFLISMYGFYSIIRRETFLVDKDFQSKKLTGKEALKYGFFYLVAGAIWIWFSISQLTGFLD